MTLVDAETGEVVDIATQDQAEAITGQIDTLVMRVNAVSGELVEAIGDALRLKAWVPLGFGSWEALVESRGWEFSPRTSTDRAALARVMRESGMAYRTIGKLVGANDRTIRRDLSNEAKASMPDTTNTTDGRSYPASRPTAELAEDIAADDLAPGEADAIADQLGEDATPEDVGGAVDEAVESRDPKPPITKPDLGGGISHPARFSDAILERFAEILDRPHAVLDPFAGTGRIHELQVRGHITTGIEIEPEYAAMHPDTREGSALELPFVDCTFDAIATSPTYGNRLADKHNASDPELRRSYTHDLGRTLHTDNSGGMQWGVLYREFHLDAWREAVRVLEPGGLFLLNIKDHIRGGEQQAVTAWHVYALTLMGLHLDPDLSGGVATSHLRQGSTTERAGQELVLVFLKAAD